MLWIEYPPAPRELILAWQAPLHVEDRFRWAVGKLRVEGLDSAVFEYLSGPDFSALNDGRQLEALQAAGYSGYPAFDAKKQPSGEFRDRVLQAFLRRLPPRSRSDFPRYLAHHYVSEPDKLSPMALLSVTEARLPSDGFSLIDPLDSSASCVDFVFEIAGYRHRVAVPDSYAVGQRLELRREPDNPFDGRAIAVIAGERVIGYVNRLQAPTIGSWLKQRALTCWIARVNDRPDMPRAFAFLQVRPATCLIAA